MSPNWIEKPKENWRKGVKLKGKKRRRQQKEKMKRPGNENAKSSRTSKMKKD